MNAYLLAHLGIASAAANPVDTGELARLLVWVAVPSAILGALVAWVIKRAVLSSARFKDHCPGPRTFAWVAIADLVVWAVLWPALLAVRISGLSSNRALWVVGLLMVIALGYFANRYGFARAFHPEVAGSVRGTMLAELFTVLMPILSVVFAIVIFFVVTRLGG